MSLTTSVTAPAALPAVSTWPMLRELVPDVAQQVFHACMDAYARPGTLHRLPVDAVPRPVPAVLAPLLALADLMTPVAAVASGAEPTADAVALAARLITADVVGPQEARFALALAEPDDLSNLNTGSHWSPEAGATLLQRVESLEAGAARGWRLTGPGVPPAAPVTLAVGGLGERFVTARAALTSDYPAGVDCLLVTDDGWVAGLPRTTVIEVI